MFPTDAAFSYLPFIPLGIEYGAIVTTLPEADDEISSAISPPSHVNFLFGDSLQTQIFVSFFLATLRASKSWHVLLPSLDYLRMFLFFQVGTNGLISFIAEYNSFINQPFPNNNYYLVAPFWDDTDTTGGNGDISYQTYESGYFLDHVSSFLRKNRSLTFQGTWMIVAYWDAVHPYTAGNSSEVVGETLKPLF